MKFSIYLATKTRWCHLEKPVDFPSVPRKGDWIQFRNNKMGDYFGFRVIDVIFREGSGIEIRCDLLDNIDERGYSFEDEAEFDEYLSSYIEAGWSAPRGITPNCRLKGTVL